MWNPGKAVWQNFGFSISFRVSCILQGHQQHWVELMGPNAADCKQARSKAELLKICCMQFGVNGSFLVVISVPFFEEPSEKLQLCVINELICMSSCTTAHPLNADLFLDFLCGVWKLECATTRSNGPAVRLHFHCVTFVSVNILANTVNEDSRQFAADTDSSKESPQKNRTARRDALNLITEKQK